ncbi:MAG: serine/threonine-protein kinase [Myxococcota bacterium]
MSAPDLIEAIRHARQLLAHGQAEDAEAALSSLTSDPSAELAVAWRELAAVWQQRGDLRRALSTVRTAVQRAEGTDQLLEALVDAAALEAVAGNATVAADHVSAVLRLAPEDDPEVRAKALVVREALELDQSPVESDISMSDPDTTSVADLGRALIEDERWEEAAAVLRDSDPGDDSDAWMLRGAAAAGTDDADVWTQVLARAHREGAEWANRPGQADALRLAARAWTRSGRREHVARAVRAHGLALAQWLREDNALEANKERRSLAALRHAPFPAGPFDLHEPLGEGGVGEVWLGRHYLRGTQVAVKVLKAGVPQQATIEDEARAVGTLEHPGIVRLLATGNLDETAAIVRDDPALAGRPWFAMELVTGGTLQDVLGTLGWSSVRAVLLDLLTALAHAHARGVLHLDLKPTNVLLDAIRSDGVALAPVPRLADFGLAGLFASLDRSRNVVMGTPRYMAPEQFLGEVGQFGPWTDLYQLGCLAWALVVGRPPYEGQTVEALRDAHLDTPFPSLPRSDAPPGFSDWLARMVAKDPTRRFDHAADAAWALRTLETPRPRDIAPGWRTPALPRAEGAIALDLFGLRRVPLVGREPLRQRLWDELRALHRDGVPRIVVLEGPDGSGRSALARWLTETAAERGVGTPVRLLESRPLASALRQVLGVHAGVLGGAPGPALRAMIAKSGERPLILDVVAAHLDRNDVVEVVEGLAREGRVLTVLRSTRGAPPTTERARTLLNDPTATRLALASPTPPEVEALVEELLPLDPVVLRQVVRQADGDMTDAIAITTALVDGEALTEQVDGRLGLRPDATVSYPETVLQTLRPRVEGLREGDRDLATVCALWRTPFTEAQFRDACDMVGVAWRGRALKRLVTAEILTSEEPYAIAHPGLVDLLVEATRQADRLTFVATLAAGRFPGPDRGARGVLYAMADQVDQALGPLLEGARAAADRGDLLAALALLKRHRALRSDRDGDADAVAAETLALRTALQRAWQPEVERELSALNALTAMPEAASWTVDRMQGQLHVAMFRGHPAEAANRANALLEPSLSAPMDVQHEARRILASLAFEEGDLETSAAHLAALPSSDRIEAMRAEVAHARGDDRAARQLADTPTTDIEALLIRARMAAWHGAPTSAEQWLGEAAARLPFHDRRARLTVDLATGWLHLAREDWIALEIEAERILRSPRIGEALHAEARWLLLPCRIIQPEAVWAGTLAQLEQLPPRRTLQTRWLVDAATLRAKGLPRARRRAEAIAEFGRLSKHHRPRPQELR